MFVLCVLYLFLFVYKGISVNEKYRRCEIIISGFKDEDVETIKIYSRYIEVKLNDVVVHTRLLSNEPLDINDDFIYQAIANEYDPNIDFRGYFEKNQTLSDLVYAGPLKLDIRYFYRDHNNNTKEQLIASIPSIPDIRCASNADWLNSYTSSKIRFDYFISYWCKGYTGTGCVYECDDLPSSKYECFYDTGEKLCKNGSYNNPPYCNQYNDTCAINHCLNGGKCVESHIANKYCECSSGYTGDICKQFTCNVPCDPDYGTCVGPNQCKCVKGRVGPLCEQRECVKDYCLNNGSCFLVSNERACNCIPTQYSGSRCELECKPTCVYGTCVEYNDKPICQCYEGFIGGSCNETVPQPDPIFQSGYVSAQNQKIIYIVVTVGLIILAVVLFGIGSVKRNKKKQKLKIIKGTAVAVQTLQMAQQQTLLNNAMLARPGVDATLRQ